MKLVKLLWADIFRDGGSYGAEFSTDEDLSYSLFLKCSPMFDDDSLHHRWLYEFRGSEQPKNSSPVLSGSIEEREIVNRLDYFLKNYPKFDNEQQEESYKYHIKQLEKMLHYILLREPCFFHKDSDK